MRLPVPTLVSAPVPDITPANVVEALFPPVVKVVLAPSCTKLLAAPASEPMASLWFRTKLAPADKLTEPASAIAAPLATANAPP